MSPQVWFVTGASSGLGRAVVEHVLSKGDIAVATLRKPEVLSDLSSKFNSSQLLVLKLDVTKPEDITAAFAQAQYKFGRIDVVYNNAGYSSLGEIEATPEEVARGLFDVNFWGAVNVSKESVKFFREVNKPCGGRLLQASSVVGIGAAPEFGFYSASKYALEGMSVALSKEISPEWNIKITILEIGPFKTRGHSQESLVTVPAHPAYVDTPAAAFRKYFLDVFAAQLSGDAAKAAREIHRIAAETDVPLRVPLGFDIARLTAEMDAIKADLVKGTRWSTE